MLSIKDLLTKLTKLFKCYASLLCLALFIHNVPSSAAETATGTEINDGANNLDPRLNEEVLLVTPPGLDKLQITLYKPDGEGPFPLIVINHGKSPVNAREQSRFRPAQVAQLFVERGYVVAAPMRWGFAQSGGQYRSPGCNLSGDALTQALSIKASIDYLKRQPLIDSERIVMIGHSQGGLASLAALTLANVNSSIKGVINFAGGEQMQGCDWQKMLVETMAKLGHASDHVPTLWVYGQNDSYFDPALVKAMLQAYKSTGGQAKLIELLPYKTDAHLIFTDRDTYPLWWPQVQTYLETLGMQTQTANESFELKDRIVRANFEKKWIKSYGSLTNQCRQTMGQYLKAPYPKFFAVSDHLNCIAAWGDEKAEAKLLQVCKDRYHSDCTLLKP